MGLKLGALALAMATGWKAYFGTALLADFTESEEPPADTPVPHQWGATSIYGILDADTVRANAATAIDGHAGFTLGEAPLSGKVYVEMLALSALNDDASTTGVGIATYLSGALPDHGIGTLATEVDMGSSKWQWFCYTGGAQVGGDMSPTHAVAPYTYRFGLCIDVATRKFWARPIYPGGEAQAYLGGGDPVAGTSPTVTLPGTDPIYLAASVRANGDAFATIAPDQLIAPPTGYAPPDVSAHMVLTGAMTAGAVGASSGAGYTATNATGAVTYRRDGAVVPGITFNADGTRSGTYTTPGTYIVYITARDSTGRLAQLREVLTVS